MAKFINRDNLSKGEVNKLYKRTKEGLITTIYSNQKSTSKRRGDIPPSYTKQELRDWLYSQELFHVLYDKWKIAGYVSTLKPSIDRLDDFKGYSFSNITLMTWADNNNKPKAKQCKGVIQMTRYKKKYIATFSSASEAGRQVGIDASTISKVARGDRDQAGGYSWVYEKGIV